MASQTPVVSGSGANVPHSVPSTALSSSTAATILSAVSNIGLNGNSRSARNAGKSRKRQNQNHPVTFSAVPNSYIDKNNDFICPICFETLDEAYITKCGHSFCYQCIIRSLDESHRCPKCNNVIEQKDHLIPNFKLNELVQKSKQGSISTKRKKADGIVHSEVSDLMNNDNLSLNQVNSLLENLHKKKEVLEADSRAAQLEILKDFLSQIKRKKQQELDKLMEEVRFLDTDLKVVEGKIDSHCSEYQSLLQNHVVPTTPTIVHSKASGTCFPLDDSPEQETSCHDGFNLTRHAAQSFHKGWSSENTAARRKRIYQHFDDLETCYFNMKKGNISDDVKIEDGLESITQTLAKFTKFTKCKQLATLNYASDIYNGSSIVSSIEFDRDCDYFAIAGVTKKIKVFEYGQVIRDVVDIHYPSYEMTCNSKISCISWSQYHRGMLSSSDYEGTVTIWDAFTGTQTQLFQEHEKRCWSVDFNTVDPNLLASGSDDAKVKLWATNMEHSVATLEAKANVCCVKFNPATKYHIAFGSADHCVHYYDLRNPKKSLAVLKGHRKAVSYAKFLDSNQIVSASTDSQLKLWDVKRGHCVKSYKGHSNEKNFVGLATNGDYIACGSENNSLYCYYKGVSKQLLTFKFDTIRGVMDRDKRDEESNEFVSAVCWKPNSNVVVAANSQGQIKVLEMV
ncbi:E3 ubiquitin-protein ligase COP1-like [Clytia hemisphaerica]|uniref:RING-type domain-containing protein n=1 Tax=Clytia hemisphaerica TaxID=252671 RepID=A0A7M5XNV9_9CNID